MNFALLNSWNLKEKLGLDVLELNTKNVQAISFFPFVFHLQGTVICLFVLPLCNVIYHFIQ